MKKITISLFLIIVGIQACFSQNAINFNEKCFTESAEHIIVAAKQLAKGQSVTDTDWDVLFGTAAYRRLLVHRDSLLFKKWMKDALIVTFDRNKKIELDSILLLPPLEMTNKDAYYPLIVKNLNELRSKLDTAQCFLSTTNFQEILSSALEKTKKFIPTADREVAMNDLNNIYFYSFFPDASVRNRGIFVDLNVAITMTKQQMIDLFAHEFHHNFRDLKKKKISSDALFHTISLLNIEGIADLVDKTPPTSPDYLPFNLELDSMYIAEFKNTPEKLEIIEEAVLNYSKNKNDVNTTTYNKLPKTIPFGGHPNGYYMALVIKKELGLDKAIQVYADPIGFIKIYNKAAKQAKNEYVFSDQFMAYLETLK